MRRDTRAVALIILVIIGASVFLAARFHQRNPIDTDILSLLPADRSTPVLADALARLNAVAANRIVLLVEGGDPAKRAEAIADLTKSLEQSGIFKSNSADGRAIWDWVFSHRTALLCPKDKALLEAGHGDRIAQDALRQWYTPFGLSNSSLLASDPMLLTPRLMQCLLGSAATLQWNGAASLVSGSITPSVFRTDVQDRLAAVIADWEARWSPSGLSLLRAGAVFHAAYAAESARWQMSIISLVTVGLILLIYYLVFGTARPALIALCLISSCLVVGLAVTLGLFTEIHVMVVVFAMALIGMVVDYSTYYLITGVAHPEASIEERRSSIFRPLTLGMVTSVGAFAALLLAPIPAFRQVAILGGVGLFFAWATALYLLPRLEGRVRPRKASADWIQVRVNRMLAVRPGLGLIALVTAATLVLAVAAWFKGEALDDVRKFQSPSAVLAAEEARIRAVTGFSASGSFFLVTGASAEEAKAHEEDLLAAAATAAVKPRVSLAASRLDPSAATLASQQDLVKAQLLDPALPGLLSQLNVSSGDAYGKGPDAALPELVKSLRGETGGTYWSIVPAEAPAAGMPAALKQGPSWTFVDPAASYGALLKQYRWIASFGLVGGAVMTGIILLIVYRRLAALWILLPAVLAMIATPSILALLGMPYSFFSAMGLLLVIGAGVDYSIFQWEHGAGAANWTRLGIFLAALMTCTSLGLLGFSSILPVASFGLNVALGVFLSLLLSPIAIFARARDHV